MKRNSDATQAKLLVVDAWTGSAEAVAALTRAAGFRVVTLSRAEAVAPLYQTFLPRLAVIAARETDSALAFEAARRLREISRGALPVVFLCEGSEDFRAQCLEVAGAVDALPWPPDANPEVALLLPVRLKALVRFSDSLRRSAQREGDAQGLRDRRTDVASHRLFGELVAHETRRGERCGDSFSVLAVKLLRFARVRRELGRDVADRLLVFASVTASQTFREADAVARVGEDELALLLPGAPAEEASTLVTRLAARFAQSRVSLGGQRVRPEVSLGVASFPDVLGGPEAYLKAAREDAQARRDLTPAAAERFAL